MLPEVLAPILDRLVLRPGLPGQDRALPRVHSQPRGLTAGAEVQKL